MASIGELTEFIIVSWYILCIVYTHTHTRVYLRACVCIDRLYLLWTLVSTLLRKRVFRKSTWLFYCHRRQFINSHCYLATEIFYKIKMYCKNLKCIVRFIKRYIKFIKCSPNASLRAIECDAITIPLLMNNKFFVKSQTAELSEIHVIAIFKIRNKQIIGVY